MTPDGGPRVDAAPTPSRSPTAASPTPTPPCRSPARSPASSTSSRSRPRSPSRRGPTPRDRQNGSFELAFSGPPTGAYELKVTKNPAGQECWVQNGAGDKGAHPPASAVRCTVVRSRSARSPPRSFTKSSTYQDGRRRGRGVQNARKRAHVARTPSPPSAASIRPRPVAGSASSSTASWRRRRSAGVEAGAPVNALVVVARARAPAGQAHGAVWRRSTAATRAGSRATSTGEHVFESGAEGPARA